MQTDNGTLYVVDDDSGARKGVAALASSMGVACETFSSAEEFLDQFSTAWRGCLLVDLRLTGMNGLQLQNKLAALGSTLPVILISAYADIRTAVRAVRDGAITLIEKPYQADELADAIREGLSADRARRETLAQGERVKQRLATLDDREQRVLEMIISGKMNKTIARELSISQRTVDRIRSSILEKMEADTAVEVARMVAEARVIHAQNSQRSLDHGAESPNEV